MVLLVISLRARNAIFNITVFNNNRQSNDTYGDDYVYRTATEFSPFIFTKERNIWSCKFLRDFVT